MALEVWWIGKDKTNKEVDRYLQRISRYTRLKLRNFKDSQKKSPEDKKYDEAGMILQQLKPEDFLILLDESGRAYSTVEWSEMLNEQWLRQKKCIFLLGGAFGVHPDVKKRASLTLSLSKLTFPHELARLILVEQLYRTFTILNNEKYHHV